MGCVGGERVSHCNRAIPLIVFTALLANCRETPTQPLPSRLEIAFSREDAPYQQNIYIMGADGSNPTPLTTGEFADVYDWSPDGTRLAYQTGALSTNYSLVIINVDGTGRTVVAGNTYNAKWSPDGSKLAYGSAHDVAFKGGASQIYTVGADGSGEVRLTNDSAGSEMGSWSPDGTHIVFSRGHPSQIFIMNASGGSELRLTNSPSSYMFPAWSPDGSRILFWQEPASGVNWVIFTINPDGSALTSLTDPSVDASFPVWSPDGKRIAFARGDAAGSQIAVMNADGSGQAVLTSGTANSGYPSWSPTGDRIAFMENTGGHLQIYVMNADGTNQSRLAPSPQNDMLPFWRPR